MRLHSDKLTASDVHAATRAAGMRGVYAVVTVTGSRTHAHGLTVTLTGTSSRYPNNGTGGRFRDGDAAGSEHAATWDEWGMLLASLFEIDPAMVAGSLKRPIYAGREHFHACTGERFEALTQPYQHGGAGHRWSWNLGERQCEHCEAVDLRIDPAPFLAALKRAGV